MMDALVKIRIPDGDKHRLKAFADQAETSISEVVRRAVNETLRGHVAGNQRRKDIASLRRSTNSMLQAFAEKPINVQKLQEIATTVRRDAVRVLA